MDWSLKGVLQELKCQGDWQAVPGAGNGHTGRLAMPGQG